VVTGVDTDGGCQRVQGPARAVGEDLQVRAEFPVCHRGEVELPRVRQRADADRHVGHQGHHREELEHRGPAKYSGTGGPGTLAA
jgi:hypothetical protein